MARIELSNIGGGGTTLSLTTTGTSGASTLVGSVLNIPIYQGQLTLTTTGTSGAATLVGDTLNIPNYATGGNPAGSTGQIQYNNAGAFAASANLAWDNSNVRLNIGAPSSPTSRLNVRGAGALSSTSSATFTNSSNNPLFSILDNSFIGIGTLSPSVSLELSSSSFNPILRVNGNSGGAACVFNSRTVATGADRATFSVNAYFDGTWQLLNTLNPTWLFQLRTVEDDFVINRATAGSSTFVRQFVVNGLGNGAIGLASGAPSARLHIQGADTSGGTNALLVQNSTPSDIYKIENNGKISYLSTNTAAGTTGAQTINRPSGTVNFAAGATALVVTNSLCTTASLVFAEVRTNDATAQIKNVVPAAGSFTINLNAAATAETSVGFFIIN